MTNSRRPNTVAVALYINAAILAVILLVLVSGNRLGIAPAAFGQAAPPQQIPIAGGTGVYVMPVQLHPSVWGCMIMDTQQKTLSIYEYRAGQQSLELIASRDFEYDSQLKNFNTDPAWSDIKKMVQQQDDAPK